MARRYDNRKLYVLLMGSCLTLIILAWFVVRLFSIPAAVGMSAVAAVLPPIAVIVANWGHDER
ncbi:DUF3099 domain-containing protein [Kribbella soli]|uniref:DUF3099 domain-containing protein n=1 Tax=Kribbella soli TaxID=1124743 RepID=A0A4R0HMP6_9ACTN|nr:DUF3099 domain-containing protein [Kribbella soli]TCC11224.1 DUF3099 domain-containing protein [Kribbella soli]